MSAEKILDQLQEVAAAGRDLIAPTREQVEELYSRAEARGCGLLVVKGRPGTLRVCPGAVVGELIVVSPDSLGGSW